MQFSSAALTAFVLSVGSVSAFTQKPATAFVSVSSTRSTNVLSTAVVHQAGCTCSACAVHKAGCSCINCRSPFATVLFSEAASAEAAEVPAEVEALDGIASDEELHNSERPARKSLKKKGPRRTPLGELKVGDSVKAKVKTLTSYGAFLDIGAQSDGLLHISQLSVDYVANVNDLLQVGQEVEVRIVNVDENKKQIGLSLLTEAQAEEAKEAASRPREQKERPQRAPRRDDASVLGQLQDKGWDADKFVEGTVVSTVDFGAFVRIDASQLNSEVEGDFDGLVHISALTAGRADSVTSVVNVDDKVQVRVKGIADKKVSLSMISTEEEEASRPAPKNSAEAPAQVASKEWKEDLEKVLSSIPEFRNRPLVVDRRK